LFVAVGDLNQDAHLDIAVAQQISGVGSGVFGVSTSMGNGHGTFDPMTLWDVGSNGPLVVGDLDGTGSPDLFVDNSLLLGNGDGTFGKLRRAATGAGPRRVALGDVDGDGNPDVVSANTGASTVTVALGSREGGISTSASYATDATPNAVVLADLDHDLKLDIITANGAGTVSILRGLAGGVFAPKADLAVGSLAYDVEAPDMNGDGNLDLVVGRSGAVSLFRGVGDGTFLTPANATVQTGARAVEVADMNGDGKLDVVSSDQSATMIPTASVHVYLGDGMGGLASGTVYSMSQGAAGPLELADLNGDGKVDVIAGSGGANVVTLLGNGDGMLQTPVNLGIPVASDVAAGDFDDDGHVDLAVAFSTGNPLPYVQALYGDGTGAFPRREYLGGGSSAYGVAIGNMDLQARPDIVLCNRDGNDVTVLLNRSSVVGVGPSGWTKTVALSIAGHPNPVREKYVAEVHLSHGAYASVTIRDLAGRLVRSLQEGTLPAGPSRVVWNLVDERGTRVRSGVYFVEVSSEGLRARSRFVVLR
jgi:hypothetical protein